MRKNGNAGGRRFDTRLSFMEMARILRLTPQQKIKMRRYLLYKIEQIIPLKEQYDTVANKDSWCWVNSYKLPIAKFNNELIGVLCSELSEGEELNKAVQSCNKRVDPVNYMKTTAPITKKQIEESKKFVE